MGHFSDSGISTNVYFAGKDDSNSCKDCKKEITDKDKAAYKGHCYNCWHHLGVRTKRI